MASGCTLIGCEDALPMTRRQRIQEHFRLDEREGSLLASYGIFGFAGSFVLWLMHTWLEAVR